VQLAAWRRAQQALLDGRAADAEYPLRVADDMLQGIGHALRAWAWCRVARCSAEPGPGGRSADQWQAAARYGIDWLLPQAQVHWSRVEQRDAALPFV
jgi:hypothetical protein